MSGSSEDGADKTYSIKRRNFLGALIGLGGYTALDASDNGSVDGSPFGAISNFLDGGNSGESRAGGFDGQYAQNSNSSRGTHGTDQATTAPQEPQTTTEQPQQGSNNTSSVDTTTDTTTANPTTTDTPTTTVTATTVTDAPTTTETPTPTDTATPTATTTATATESPEYEELEPACDRLYLQSSEDSNQGNGDGTVIGLDLADREYRIFTPSQFPQNEELTGLYDEIVEDREKEDLPADLGRGVRTTREEVLSYSADAYDDMADEEEWDTIFDENEETGCEL